jgi:peptidoglycan L-alanyl-D-glutamate endopeptidase CwlK
MFKLGQRSLNNRAGVDHRLIEISDRAIQISTVDFGHGPYSGLRSVDDQAGLFQAGRSKCDGRANLSYHQSGRALDVFAYVDNKASWEKEHLAIIAAAMLQAANELGHKLEWGGLWKGFCDMPHFQLGE